nr:MBL fold metallo-hydrolase [Desulfobulbaceae bacterium]
MNYPEIVHIGGEQTVTGSCHLVRACGITIMVDCGLYQGGDADHSVELVPTVNPHEIDYLFLTHAHIDHIGRLPDLIATGFSGEIICSHPTKALLAPMLTDTMRLSGYSKNQEKKILAAIEELSWGFEYNTSFKLKKGIEFKLGRAGHILGSSFISFKFPSVKASNAVAVTFSGDLGNKDTPILCDPDPPEHSDLLILESTYGDRLHEGRSQRQQKLRDVLGNAFRDGGKVFVPAFSLGRTQEFLFELDRLYGDKPPAPVFVDSPLGLKITKIYSELSAFWDKESSSLLASGDHPFDFNHLYSVASFREHKELLEMPGPAIIIAGSGMCSGGRILDHLATGLADKRNDIFFVGYQAHGTLGRKIIEFSNRANGYVLIGSRKVAIKAKVHKLSGYSAHADQKGLVDWVASMLGKPGRIKLVHGELESRTALSEILLEKGYNVEP